jgi:hypothetical protein
MHLLPTDKIHLLVFVGSLVLIGRRGGLLHLLASSRAELDPESPGPKESQCDSLISLVTWPRSVVDWEEDSRLCCCIFFTGLIPLENLGHQGWKCCKA